MASDVAIEEWDGVFGDCDGVSWRSASLGAGGCGSVAVVCSGVAGGRTEADLGDDARGGNAEKTSGCADLSRSLMAYRLASIGLVGNLLVIILSVSRQGVRGLPIGFDRISWKLS